MAKRYFVTGIGTGVGKTLAAAILTEALHADYWKPIQSGTEEGDDTETMKNLVTNTGSKFYPEAYRLPKPLSPHAAAKAAGISISLQQIVVPVTTNTLIVEGAGGLLVPLNDTELVADLIRHIGAEVIVVSRHYLGSINHTLLTLQVIKNLGLPLKGIIFSGDVNHETESAILRSGVHLLGRINEERTIDRSTVSRYAATFAKLKW